MTTPIKNRCSDCGYAGCKVNWQSRIIATTTGVLGDLALLDHRYMLEGPEPEQCCESAGFCQHDALGYEPDTRIRLRCTHCDGAEITSVPTSGGGLVPLMKAIADHENSVHPAS